jgi:hypothetical protein
VTFLCWLGCPHCQPCKAAHTLWAPCVLSCRYCFKRRVLMLCLGTPTPQHSQHSLPVGLGCAVAPRNCQSNTCTHLCGVCLPASVDVRPVLVQAYEGRCCSCCYIRASLRVAAPVACDCHPSSSCVGYQGGGTLSSCSVASFAPEGCVYMSGQGLWMF